MHLNSNTYSIIKLEAKAVDTQYKTKQKTIKTRRGGRAKRKEYLKQQKIH